MPRQPRPPRPSADDVVARRLALIGASRAPDAPVPPLAPPPAPLAPPPVPGRHVARRAGSGRDAVAGLVPEPLRGRFSLGPAQVAVVAVLVAAAIATTGWWLVRAESAQVEAPPSPGVTSDAPPLADASPVAAGSAGGAEGSGSSSGRASSQAGTVTVDVIGKVRRPGIVVLESGSRVVDAVEAAGGARRGVDTSSLNLARLLVDGEQIAVGRPPSAAAAAAPAGASGPSGGVLVNLNTASATELEELPDVGPVTAESIVSWREEHGGFTAVDELLEVDGIGNATLAKIAPHATV